MTMHGILAISIEFLRKLIFEKEIEVIFKTRGIFGDYVFCSKVKYDFSFLLFKIIPEEKDFKTFKHCLNKNPRCSIEINLEKLAFTDLVIKDLKTPRVDPTKNISIECELNYINNEQKYFKVVITEIKLKDNNGKTITEILKGI